MNSSVAKYSVVIPMYNASSTIIRALKSIEYQTAYALIGEIIIVDDGSLDDSYDKVLEFVEENKLNIRVIRKENGGVASARNIGIKSANYEWIALLDSDDEWLPEKIEFQNTIILNNSNVDLLGCEINDKPVDLLYKKFSSLTKIKTYDILIKMFPQTSTIIFRKKIFSSIGGFSETLSHGEDGRFLVEVCHKYNYYYHPRKLVIYDGGKQGFGVSGLSANLKKMQEAQMKNLDYFFRRKIIGRTFYCSLKIFYTLKYLRRIVKVRKIV